jgi:hypothetical protein
MRKPYLILNLMLCVSVSLAVMLLSSCSQQQSGGTVDNRTAADARTVKAFVEFTTQGKGPVETKKYMDSLMPGAGTGTADALINEYISYLEAAIASGLDGYADDPAITAAGIKFAESEGEKEPVIDYHFIDSYSGKVSEQMKDYAAFMALDSDRRWATDAEIGITLEELGDRIAKAETFLVKYPDADRVTDVQSKYRIYLSAFLGGTDNSPLADYGTGKVKDEFINAYEYFIKTYSGLKTAETVSKHYEELKAAGFAAPYGYSDYEKQTAFRKHVDDMVQGAVDKL